MVKVGLLKNTVECKKLIKHFPNSVKVFGLRVGLRVDEQYVCILEYNCIKLPGSTCKKLPL